MKMKEGKLACNLQMQEDTHNACHHTLEDRQQSWHQAHSTIQAFNHGRNWSHAHSAKPTHEEIL